MGMSQEEIEALMNESADLAPAIEETTVEDVSDDTPMSEDDIASLVAANNNETNTTETANSTQEVSVAEDMPNMDDILAGIDGVTDDTPKTVDPEQLINQQIDQGVYPLPVE